MKQVIKDIWAAIKYVISPPPADPKTYAQDPPKNWHGATPVEPCEGEEEVQKTGGTLVWDGEFTRFEGVPVTLAHHGITAQEWGEMQEYQVSKTQKGLKNLALAGQIKQHWLEGKRPPEIAALVGYNASTVRQYVICLEKAAANKGNAFQVGQNPSPTGK